MIQDVLPGSLCQTAECQITLWFTVTNTEYWTAPACGPSYTVHGCGALYDMELNVVQFREDSWKGYTYVLGDGDGLLL